MRTAQSELGLPRLYGLDEVTETFESAGFSASVANLKLGFIPVSAHRHGHDHRGIFSLGWPITAERRSCFVSHAHPPKRVGESAANLPCGHNRAIRSSPIEPGELGHLQPFHVETQSTRVSEDGIATTVRAESPAVSPRTRVRHLRRLRIPRPSLLRHARTGQDPMASV